MTSLLSCRPYKLRLVRSIVMSRLAAALIGKSKVRALKFDDRRGSID
jgi:hypothetical protein